MSSSPNGSASATRDRPTGSERRTARIAGIFLVITFISIPVLPLYDPVLNHTHFIVGGGGDLRVELGALFEVITLIAGIGTAVALYPRETRGRVPAEKTCCARTGRSRLLVEVEAAAANPVHS